MKAAWIISDIDVDEEVQPHWRMYAYADILRGLNYETINFFSDNSILRNDIGYRSALISDIFKLLPLNKPIVAIVYTWCKNPHYLGYLKKNNVIIINRIDSDGKISYRHNPFDTWLYMVYPLKGIIQKAKATKFWLSKYIFEGRSQIQELVKSFESSDAVAVASPGGTKKVIELLEKIKQKNLTKKICYVPNPTSKEFFGKPIGIKTKKIIAIADWNNPYTSVWKNESLLINVIKRGLINLADYRFLILGRGAIHKFQKIFDKFDRVQIVDQVQNSQLPEFLADCQILLVTSRREGAPIVVNEALAMGCTVVSTPLDGVHFSYGNITSGTKSRSFSLQSFFEALVLETRRWASDKHDPDESALFWRSVLNEKAIGEKIESIIQKSLLDVSD